MFSPLDSLELRKAMIREQLASRLERGMIVPGTEERAGAEVLKSVSEPDVVKVGPHGYVHGWIHVGSNDPVPGTGHAVQQDAIGGTHVYHNGHEIGTVIPFSARAGTVGDSRRYSARPANTPGKSSTKRTMADALDHIAKKAGVSSPSGKHGNDLNISGKSPSKSKDSLINEIIDNARPGEVEHSLSRGNGSSHEERARNYLNSLSHMTVHRYRTRQKTQPGKVFD